MNIKNEVVQQRLILEKAVADSLELAKSYHVAAEVLVIKNTGINISTRNCIIENMEFHSDCTLGLTVYYKKNKGFASSNDISYESISRTFNAALNIARYTSSDPYSGIADQELLAFNPIDLDLFHPIEFNIKYATNLAAETEEVALQQNKNILHSEGSYFNSYFTIKTFGNTYDMLQSYNSSKHSLSCCVIAKDNDSMERNYAYTIGRSFKTLRSPKWVGKECANRTIKHLGSKKISTMESPVIFVAEMATSLFHCLAKAISGKYIYRRFTFLLDYLGKNVLPTWISIEEKPHLLQGLASAPFDNEGIKTRSRMIIKNGVLQTWLLNTYSARKLGFKSTGHANGIYNWIISYYDINFKTLLKKMHRGLVVTELMGQGVNIITGDYSRGVSGFWVDNGTIQYPVSEITIAGNLKNIFRNILYISNDIEKRNSIQCGSTLVSSMKIAGK